MGVSFIAEAADVDVDSASVVDDNNDDANPGGADGAILLVADVAVNVDPFKEVLVVVVVVVVATTCDLTLTAGGALLLVVGAADIDAIW